MVLQKEANRGRGSYALLYGVFKTYDVKLEHNDDDRCLDIYVDGERVGVIPYNKLANLEEDEVNAKIKDTTEAAILEYQVRHKSDT